MENCSIVCLNGKQVNVYAHFVCLRLTVCLLQVTKAQVDSYNFMPKEQIPSCQLMAVWTGKSKPSRLIHKVILEGAKKPSNYFYIDLDCDSTTPSSKEGVRGELLAQAIMKSRDTRENCD